MAQLEIDYIVVNLREKRLHWFVHVEQFSGAIKTVCDMQIEVERGPGRPKTTWMTLTDRDLREWKLNEFDPSDRDVLTSKGISAMLQLASFCRFGNFRVTFISRSFDFEIISKFLNSRASNELIKKAI